jgi:alanine-glyoxylate transaminase/serine-glyoxylate transaminase/serine-pyruvate transaminase
LTDVLALSGIAAIEMAMKDLDYPIELGAGVAAAQAYYRQAPALGQASANKISAMGQ